jgi:hypothetical protein
LRVLDVLVLDLGYALCAIEIGRTDIGQMAVLKEARQLAPNGLAMISLPDPSLPWLILDWNLIQTMPANRDIPQGYECIVPDQLFHELAGKASNISADHEKARDLAWKLGGWAKRNLRRIWAAETVEYLFELQFASEGQPIKISDLIDEKGSEQIRSMASNPEYDWGAATERAARNVSIRNREDQTNFLQGVRESLVEVFKSQFGVRPFEQASPDLVDMVMRTEKTADSLATMFPNKWRPEWQPLLAEDLNRFAVARYFRLFLWYSFRLVPARIPARRRNDLDDLHYALLASYTGHLGTSDYKLHQASLELSPKVRFVTNGDLVNV